MSTKRKSKYSEETQEAIDEGWNLYNTAKDACEELNIYLDELSDEHGIDTSRASEAAHEAFDQLESTMSTGGRILPPYSGDL